ncbi:hypothetical protein Bpfe_001518 [Biomphalaria pfeifferi]|uniref:Uncharacterized protein n=1 Tax=Biomphalaria pfeifferi TaxID=112525 RepID=A0AAD8FMZ0_BIOPF|nr:hypothetical protein Bpfe_001518 [Biomphalaria pfeifferi]
MAVALGNTTVVNDLQSEKTYITENGTCQSSDLPKDPYPQCLPANAVQLANITVGLGSNQLTGTVWQFPYNNGVLKVAFTNVPNAPNYPFLTRFVDDKGVVSASFFVDIATNITQPALLKIPDLCPPKVIV